MITRSPAVRRGLRLCLLAAVIVLESLALLYAIAQPPTEQARIIYQEF